MKSKLARPFRLEQLEPRSLLTAGMLDSSFGSGGIVNTDFGSTTSEIARGVAIYPSTGTAHDGKIVAVGGSDQAGGEFAISRYSRNGVLDTSFSGDGKLVVGFGSGNDVAIDVAIQSDEKIVVAGAAYVGGNYDVAVVRVDAAGKLDSTFGSKGKVTTGIASSGRSASDDFVEAVALQADGKIVVAGGSNLPGGVADNEAIVLARYTASGSLDPTFDGDGKVITSWSAVAGSLQLLVDDMKLSADGKILVVGKSRTSSNWQDPWNVILARYNPSGSLDSSFGTGGIATLGATDSTTSVALAIQNDGKIVAGWSETLVRLSPTTGTLDTTFGTGGIAPAMQSTEMNALAVQADGKIVATGGSVNFGRTVRYDSNGTLDLTFGSSGVAATRGYDLAVQPDDGKIVLAGRSAYQATTGYDFELSRLLNDSALTAAAVPAIPLHERLTLDQVQPIWAESMTRWQAAGFDVVALSNVQIQIANLSGKTLGLAGSNTIWLDDNASGWGWFVDPTPSDDSEFVLPGNQGEQNRIDLLTVVMHELGHLLGHYHDAEGVMAETLAAGVRRTGLDHDDISLADQILAQAGDHRADAWLGAWLSEQFDSAHGRAKRRQ